MKSPIQGFAQIVRGLSTIKAAPIALNDITSRQLDPPWFLKAQVTRATLPTNAKLVGAPTISFPSLATLMGILPGPALLPHH